MTTATAILHDQFRTLGGAERVACEMARALDAPIYAARVNESVVPEDVDIRCIVKSRLGRRAMHGHYLAQDAYQMIRWQTWTGHQEFDTIIVNKTNPAWFVPKEEQTVLWYLHSTPRGLYDQYARRDDKAPLLAPIKTVMRTLYETNRVEPDLWLCNSEVVQRRLECYSGVPRADPSSRVLHPPVDTHGLSPKAGPNRDHYLVLGRLRGHKRVGEAIRATNDAGVPLHIAGTGPKESELAALADRLNHDVTFHGYVDEQTKAQLLASSRALIMPAENEDFGLTPIEAFASGTPVIGVNEGYTQYQIEHGETGLVYERGELADAIRQFKRDGVSATAEQLTDVAADCSVERFRERIREAVAVAQERASVSADWSQDAGIDTESLSERVVADGGDDA